MISSIARPLAALTAAVSVIALAPTASADALGRYSPGSEGVGDPYFPSLGNGGYDVGHYSLKLAYDPEHDQLDGTVTVTAKATMNLSRFNLDLSGMDVEKVEVNGRKAKFKRRGKELIITPSKGLLKSREFTASVTYGGVPETIVGSPIVFGSPYGFLHTDDGAFVGGAPDGASTWFPSNDHPSDKAAYDYAITVPKGLRAIANGRLVSRKQAETWFSQRARPSESETFRWHEDSPMTTYLTTIDIGKWKVKEGKTTHKVPVYVATDPALDGQKDPDGNVIPDATQYFYDHTVKATEMWTQTFGKYPFNTTGAIADNALHNGEPLRFSLETNGKPVYSRIQRDTIIAHELAHQWFGDSVGPRDWQQVWLNESFARWSDWYYQERTGRDPASKLARATYNSRPFPDPADKPYWSVVITDPKRDTMFNQRVYGGGAMVLQFLREKIGDEKFFLLLRTWVKKYADKTVVTKNFTDLAEKVSGEDLDAFFKTWIYSPGKPPLP